ncbi:MAG: phage tail tape measure C-terminal domain-containing protein, partial [Dehalococcoidales bacterium]|nr:phage tail tape measure C-terminal domain-containing protein [Dehalococcoidales bacterium]
MAAKLAASWLAAYGTIASVRSITMAAARYETLGIVLEQVGKNAGYTAAQMHEFAKGLQDSGISMTASRQALTRMTQAQLGLTKAAQLGRVAQDAAVVGNINSSEAFERMVYGIQSGQTEILRTIGLNVSFEQGYQKTAKTLGKTAAQLTETEKAQSRLNAVLEYGEHLSGIYEKSMQTMGKQLGSLQRHIENFQVLSGEIFLPVFSEMIKDVTKQITDLNNYLAGPGAQAIDDWGEKFKEAYVKIRDSIAGVNREITNFQKAHPIISEGLGDVGELLLTAAGYALAFQVALLSIIKSFRLLGLAAAATFGPTIKLAGLVATAIGGITLAAIAAGGAIPLIGAAMGALAVYIIGLKIGEKIRNEWDIAGRRLGEHIDIWYTYFSEFLVKVEYVFSRMGDVIETIMRGVSASIKVIVGEIVASFNKIPGISWALPDTWVDSAKASAEEGKAFLSNITKFSEDQKKASEEARDAKLAEIAALRELIKNAPAARAAAEAAKRYAKDYKKYGPALAAGAGSADIAGLAAAEAASRAKVPPSSGGGGGKDAWAGAMKAMQRDLRMSGLQGAPAALEEIRIKAEELRAKFGDKPLIKVWEEDQVKQVKKTLDEEYRKFHNTEYQNAMYELNTKYEGYKKAGLYDTKVHSTYLKELEALNKEYHERDLQIREEYNYKKQELDQDYRMVMYSEFENALYYSKQLRDERIKEGQDVKKVTEWYEKQVQLLREKNYLELKGSYGHTPDYDVKKYTIGDYLKTSSVEMKRHIAEMILVQNDLTEAANLSFKEYATYAENTGQAVHDALSQALYKTEDKLVEFCMTGKANFKDLANSIMEDIMRIYIRSQILGPIAKGMEKSNWLGAAIDALGRMLSFGGGSSALSSSAPSIDVGFQTGAPALVGAMAKGGTIPSSNLTNTILTKPTL